LYRETGSGPSAWGSPAPDAVFHGKILVEISAAGKADNMTGRKKNKEEFLKYAKKQRQAVRGWTDYWLFGAWIAAAMILFWLLAGR
jgi:hypothetical protein